MVTSREDLHATLAVHDPDALRLILLAAEVDPAGATTSADLASRIAEAIWWNFCTPLGYYADRTSLEQIVGHVARKLQVSDRVPEAAPVWSRLDAMTRALVPQAEAARGVAASDLDASTQDRLGRSWMPTVGYGSGAVSSLGARWTSAQLIKLLDGPLGRLLPFLPVVGRWFSTIRWGAGAVKLVTGPLGIALSVASLNSTLGANYRRLVPLLLGVGALGPDPVSDAEVVG